MGIKPNNCGAHSALSLVKYRWQIHSPDTGYHIRGKVQPLHTHNPHFSDINTNITLWETYTILDEITRTQLIWFGHVERMDPTRLPKIMIHWKPEGRKKRGRPRRTWKDWIFTAMNERDLRMGEWKDRRQWNMAAGRRRQTFKTALYIFTSLTRSKNFVHRRY